MLMMLLYKQFNLILNLIYCIILIYNLPMTRVDDLGFNKPVSLRAKMYASSPLLQHLHICTQLMAPSDESEQYSSQTITTNEFDL